MNEADLIIEQAKKEAEEIINIAFCDAEKIIDNAKDEAKKIIEEADYLLKEYEHIHKDRSRILSTLQSLEESSYIEDDWQLKCTQDYLKRINKIDILPSLKERDSGVTGSSLRCRSYAPSPQSRCPGS